MSDDLAADIGAAYDAGTPESGTPESPPESTPPPSDPGPAAAPEPALEAPPVWPANVRENFRNLDRTYQQFLLDRHKDTERLVQRRTQEAAQARKQWQAINEILEPHRAMYQRAGMDDLGAVKFLLQTNAALQRDPAGTIAWLAQRSGVDLKQLVDAPQVPPEIQQLHQEINSLKSQLGQFSGQYSEQQLQSLSNQVAEWSQAKDETGNPRFPHFDDVAEEMLNLIHAMRARGQVGPQEMIPVSKLQDIYDRAVWANPTTRARVIAEQEAAKQKKAADEQAKKVAEAKRAGFDVKGQGGAQVAPANDSLRAALESAYTSSMGR